MPSFTADVSTDLAIALVVLVLAIGLVQFVWPAINQDESDRCGQCAHERRHHHGPCQACLRDQVAGDSDRTPCGRFRTS